MGGAGTLRAEVRVITTTWKFSERIQGIYQKAGVAGEGHVRQTVGYV